MVEGLRNMEASQSDALNHEVSAFCLHLNTILATSEDLGRYLPLTENNLFENLRDGVVLSHLLHHYYPGSIRLESLVRGLDLSQMNQVHTKVIFEVNANLNLVVSSAKSIKNLVIVNLGAEDILNCNRDLVLGLLWQIFNTKMASNINLQAHPELVRLVEENETLASLVQLKPEALLNRWFNHHLKRSGTERRASNLGRDLIDSELYVRLMHQVAPKTVFQEDIEEVMAIPSDSHEGLLKRAGKVADLAQRLGCQEFASPENLVQGHPRLNYAFTATLFNKNIGLTLASDEDVQQLRDQLNESLKENTELKTEIQLIEFGLATTTERFQADMDLLKEEMCKQEIAKKAELEEQSNRFELAKEELASQYQDSLESALESEKRTHQDEMWDLLLKQKESCRQLLGILGILRQQFTTEELEAAKFQEPAGDELEMDSIIRGIGELSSNSSRKVISLEAASEHLRTSVAHKEKVNEIMGDKIREYTEQVIHCKKDASRRGSLLRRIFTQEK
ncbi:Actinin-type, actin-binding domain-containing protein [Paramicrosporidium saccamoebae]|uniref:Actinin-type, actin-binding domain-containing protein n=1 Tax=Paramicrosporidium saccamoebae TaxID=1246581 RepID=A0A2H9THD9_9FUNG|nr:Actinin-type, actin-binding domain-containing protein [Paramicrosporidium saccamoebae]